MRLSSRLQRALLVTLTASFCVVVSTSPAGAQFRSEHRERQASIGSSVNLFFDWSGSVPVAGYEVDLPDGWKLEAVDAVRRGFVRIPGRLEKFDEAENRFRFQLQEVVRDEVSIVVRVTLPPFPDVEDVSVAPLLRSGEARDALAVDRAYEAKRRIHAERRAQSNANRALVFDAGTRAPLQLRTSRIPDLDSEASFSVEFWLKTLSLDQVVLSTWDGREESAYPVEMVVSPHGRLLFYRGRPGEHHAASTVRPVADGVWHHVALAHDGGKGWTRLYLDGEPQDSLFAPNAPRISSPETVAIGGRPGGTDERAGSFVGEIDELRFWSGARSASAIRHGMRRSLAADGGGDVFLDFDAPVPNALLAVPTSLRRERSDLSFAHPVQELRAKADGENVSLTWETDDPQTRLFLIERSLDSRTFEKVGRLDANDAVGETSATGLRRYEFIETQVAEQVVYYRIRQQMRDGSERVTASVKIGLGAAGDSHEAVLVGNYPNPFNTHTTITYSLERAMQVRLSVWDVAGQPVAELVNAEQEEGFHEIAFDASELPSGTYFVRLQSPDHVGWRTLTLMK